MADPGIIKKTLTSGLQRAAAKGMTPTIKADCVAEKPKDLKYSGKNGSKHPVAAKLFLNVNTSVLRNYCKTDFDKYSNGGLLTSTKKEIL